MVWEYTFGYMVIPMFILCKIRWSNIFDLEVFLSQLMQLSIYTLWVCNLQWKLWWVALAVTNQINYRIMKLGILGKSNAEKKRNQKHFVNCLIKKKKEGACHMHFPGTHASANKLTSHLKLLCTLQSRSLF